MTWWRIGIFGQRSKYFGLEKLSYMKRDLLHPLKSVRQQWHHSRIAKVQTYFSERGIVTGKTLACVQVSVVLWFARWSKPHYSTVIICFKITTKIINKREQQLMQLIIMYILKLNTHGQACARPSVRCTHTGKCTCKVDEDIEQWCQDALWTTCRYKHLQHMKRAFWV